MHGLLLIDVAKVIRRVVGLLVCFGVASGFGEYAYPMDPCGRCSAADKDTVSNWANFSVWNETTSFDHFFAPVPCNSSISVRGGRLRPSEFSLSLLQVRIEERDYIDHDPLPRPKNLAAKSSATCTLCDRGNFAVPNTSDSEDAFVELDRTGYAVDFTEMEDDGDEDKIGGAKSPVEPSISLLISFVDDHFVGDWGAVERVFERPQETEPVAGLESAHWPYMSVVRPRGVKTGRLWFYFKKEGYGVLFRAESQDDGLTWGPAVAVQLVNGVVNHAYGVTVNENPRCRELGEPDYLLVGDCPAEVHAGYEHHNGTTNLWTACVFGSADGLQFTSIADPATSSWAKHDFQLADSVNQVLWCPRCQAHVLSSRYAPQSPKKWRHCRGMGFWRAATISPKAPLFELDTWIKFDKQGPLECRFRQMYGVSGSWIDGIYHGTVLLSEIPDSGAALSITAPTDRWLAYFFTTRDMRNFTFTSVYARHPLVGHSLDMWATVFSNSLVRAKDRWGYLHATFPLSHLQQAVPKQQASAKKTSMSWWKPHRMSGLSSAWSNSKCFSFLSTKWLRLDAELRAKPPSKNLKSENLKSRPLVLKINCNCSDWSKLGIVVRARGIHGDHMRLGAKERVIATSKPIRGDLLRAPVRWQVTETGTPHVMVDFSREQLSLTFKIKGECTIYSVWIDI